MTSYAIGSVHGDYPALIQLLQKIGYEADTDRLGFAGNLVNSGPDSLAVLRFVKNLGKNAVTVLGSQELHLLSVAAGIVPSRTDDTFDDILAAEDKDELLKWLRQRTLIHHDSKLNFTMVHAGIPTEWTFSQALTFAYEVESVLVSGQYIAFLENRRQDQTRWHAKLTGWKRTNFITNAYTAMAYCTDQGKLDFREQGPIYQQTSPLVPWYRLPNRITAHLNIVFSDEVSFEDSVFPGIFPLACQTVLSALKLTSDPEVFSIERNNGLPEAI
ncbi:symmetrical bis(5'-nucleosyl)-tetraphosphatase [Methylicorpusculum oleiharenae]|uniref:symmetrical bis(5'-nucleosyl)-tetraphosphatase n=1 Tax=Methylicorpusculum oleiharenae TaxID=1338687 RepID=UPI00135AC3A0|nr:symmetrical bis(5'-nucleosyl)-tetraphosphatase [Methylicorpusculum oleiharenae]MCD2452378.1 symmetrical bis(5'-nucleosyl)-tetraphosphatase [Methylicorpusculum oleiharenae]